MINDGSFHLTGRSQTGVVDMLVPVPTRATFLLLLLLSVRWYKTFGMLTLPDWCGFPVAGPTRRCLAILLDGQDNDHARPLSSRSGGNVAADDL